jgi:hypothetical protein
VQGGNTPGPGGEKIEANFRGYVDGAYKANGIVFACIAARQLLFSEARFQFRRLRFGRPGDLFGTPRSASSRSRGRARPPAICSPRRSLTSTLRATSTRSAATTRSSGSARTG